MTDPNAPPPPPIDVGVAANPIVPAPFVPVIPPPSHYDGMAAGLSTEKGDSAKTAFEKINAGFAHVYALLTGSPSATPQAAPVDPAHAGILSDLEARLKQAETALAAVPTHAMADLSALVNKTDLAPLLAAIESHAGSITSMQNEIKQLEGMLNRAINLVLHQAPDTPPPPPPAG